MGRLTDLFFPEMRASRLLPRLSREAAVKRLASLRDVEMRIYPDGGVSVVSMTTWQTDDGAEEALRVLVNPSA
jgi:hypothetical protein